MEAEVDAQIAVYREKLQQEEERERLQLQKDSEAILRQTERDLEEKFEREKGALVDQYARIRKTVEETERERYEFELEKFKKEQGRGLESHKSDIERLKGEKKKI
jgi:hypothetical protein